MQFFLLLSAICVFALTNSFAQTPKSPHVVSSILTPKGVYVYSYTPGKADTKGFRIEALDGSGKVKWERVVLPDTSAGDLERLGPAYVLTKDQINYYKQAYPELRSDNRVFMYSLYDFVFGAMSGFSFLDSEIKAAENYHYKIADIATGEVREIKGRFVEPTKFKVKLLKSDPLTKASYIEWERLPSSDLIGYNIYMSYQKTRDFVRLNERPIVVPEWFNKKKVKSGSYTHDLPKDYAGTPLFYKVECLYAGGIAGGESEVVDILPMKEALFPPSIVNIEKDKEGLSQIYWRSAGNTSQILGFNIYYSFGKEGNYEKYNAAPIAAQQYKTVLKLDRRGTYYLRMTAVHKNGTESERSGFLNYFFEPGIASDMVKNVKLSPRPGAILLTWDAVPDCIDYWIYRSYGKFQEGQHVATVKGNKSQYLDNNLDADNTYWYVVRAIQRNKVEGLMHAPVSAAPQPGKTLKKLHALRGRLNNNAAILEWSRMDTPDVAGYNIYMRKAGGRGGEKTRLNKEPVNAVLFEHDLGDAGEFEFTVAAVGRDGAENALSDALVLKYERAKIPSPTIRMIAPAKNGGVVVQWNVVLSDVLSRYRIYRKEAREHKYRRVGEAKNTDDSFADRSAKKKSQYSYYVVSVDKQGVEAYPGAERIVILK